MFVFNIFLSNFQNILECQQARQFDRLQIHPQSSEAAYPSQDRPCIQGLAGCMTKQQLRPDPIGQTWSKAWLISVL